MIVLCDLRLACHASDRDITCPSLAAPRPGREVSHACPEQDIVKRAILSYEPVHQGRVESSACYTRSYDFLVTARAFAAMAVFAPVDCLHMCWLKDKDICARLDEGGRLIRSTDGATFVTASEEHCVENAAFMEPYMARQCAAKSLDIPDIEAFKGQLLSLHMTRAAQKVKGTVKPKALVEATMELVHANSHLDAKALKRLFSYCRHRYLKTKKQNSVREPHMQFSAHALVW